MPITYLDTDSRWENMSTPAKIGLGVFAVGVAFFGMRVFLPKNGMPVLQDCPAGLGSPYMMQYNQNGKLEI